MQFLFRSLLARSGMPESSNWPPNASTTWSTFSRRIVGLPDSKSTTNREPTPCPPPLPAPMLAGYAPVVCTLGAALWPVVLHSGQRTCCVGLKIPDREFITPSGIKNTALFPIRNICYMEFAKYKKRSRSGSFLKHVNEYRQSRLEPGTQFGTCMALWFTQIANPEIISTYCFY